MRKMREARMRLIVGILMVVATMLAFGYAMDGIHGMKVFAVGIALAGAFMGGWCMVCSAYDAIRSLPGGGE
jgi:hypothetical protein